MFRKVLVANRGEIAVRILRTCREMGISSVAVYSDADARALHVRRADEAVRIGGPEPAHSYLDMDAILTAAEQTGAEAIHPGYGFLAENPDFAQRCADAGRVFIGPPPAAMRALGNKIEARLLMRDSRIPVIPGTMAKATEAAEVLEAAREIGFPLLLKATAGGGGKGMRIVHEAGALADAFESAAREATKAFGDGTLYLERYFRRVRHIEVQVLADAHGNAVHLHERECSIQRRHQKIIEETPSPALTPRLRDRVCAAALQAVKAAGYVNAGTVEFLLTPEGEFYFLEVNARVQVEHPITEMVTGIDIVRQQLEIAAGAPLRFSQADIAARGHAIECRIYAEDPAAGFIPSPGRIVAYREPHGPGLRVDSGVTSGSEVPLHYDPIVAKLVAHAEDRPAAIQRLARALEDYAVLGIQTPIPFLLDVIRSAPFAAGDIHTELIAEHFTPWSQGDDDRKAALIAYVLDQRRTAGKRGAAAGAGGPGAPSAALGPWDVLGTWRIDS
ncbi:MAG: acetyl-CoA carboxylase biotin carboxylase subunit [Candidatus Schekmanbacteria bacterium]|nr:acetyl-CoA carboxylase biotin carboxylase subunit [Candidatus Schekmanbacteria bacterium]